MKLDGTSLAQELLTKLSLDVRALSEQGIRPTLSVISVGDDPGSASYIKQKQKAGSSIGIVITHLNLPVHTSNEEFVAKITADNNNPSVHGIIIQRPIPKQSSIQPDMLMTIDPHKDVDGFLPASVFPVPVAVAVTMLLQRAHKQMISELNFPTWLSGRNVVVIGHGETAGKPIAEYLGRHGANPTIVDSKTKDPEGIYNHADIIVSCVGKPGILTSKMIRTGTILISVGISRDGEGKLHGDYEESDIADTASYYTPTPGGVGPLNVACLMQNVIQAAQSTLLTND